VVIRCVVKAAIRRDEAGQDRVGEASCGREPPLVERGLVQGEQAIGEMRVILEDSRARGPTVFPGAAQPTLPVEETPRLCGWGAELVSIVAEECFNELDGPPLRITTPHIPLPSADALEDMAIPSIERIVTTIERAMQS